MKSDAGNRRTIILALCFIYSIISTLVTVKFGMSYILFSLLPTVLVYMHIHLYKNKFNPGVTLVMLGILVFVKADFESILFLFYYSIMALVIYLVLKTPHPMFKKAVIVVLIMLISVVILFSAIDFMSEGPGFFETLNSVMGNSEFLKEVSKIVEENSGKPAVDLTTVDTGMLRVIVSSVIPVMLFILVAVISLSNFALISVIMNAKNKFVPRVNSLWKMSFPRSASKVMLLILILAFLVSGGLGDFGVGIFITIFMLSMFMFMVQGVFLTSHFILKFGVKSALNVVVTILLGGFMMMTSLGTLVLLNGGFIDLIFNIRKLPRGGAKNENK